MKKICGKVLLFILLEIIILIGIDFLSMTDALRMPFAYLTNSEEYVTTNVGAEEIIPYINKVQEKSDATKLVVGDSVCAQMCNGLQQYNEDICIVGSNSAITLSGQYILIHQFLENHEQATDVFLILLPSSLGSDYDTKYGYEYVVMPWVETDTLKLLDDVSITKMEEVYGKIFLNENVTMIIEHSAINRKLYLNILQETKRNNSEGLISDVSVLYLNKIEQLCEEKNVKLHLYPGPIADTNARHEQIEKLQKECVEKGLDKILQQYFKFVTFYPIEHFRDGVHLGGDFANRKAYNNKIKEMYRDSKLLEELRFE